MQGVFNPNLQYFRKILPRVCTLVLFIIIRTKLDTHLLSDFNLLHFYSRLNIIMNASPTAVLTGLQLVMEVDMHVYLILIHAIFTATCTIVQ